MKKFIVLGILLLLCVGVLLFLFLGKDKKNWEGNILLITLDTTRADTIGCYGNPEVKTPNLDRMAKNGIRFENCYSPVPLTLPSHCTIFTGKYPLGHGVRNNGNYYLKNGEHTLTEIFKQEGYHTYAVVAAYVLLSKFGLNQGFDIYDDSLNSRKLVNTFRSEIKADEVYGKFDGWFEKNREKKFFAWVHFFDPHTPYNPPEGYFDEKNKDDGFTCYKGEISFMDVYVGKIIEKMDNAGILEKTLVVVVGDHGEAFGEHEEYAGHSIFCYQENIKVPFLLYNRFLFKKPAVITERVNTADIMPTLLELKGIKKTENLQGKTLMPLLNGEKLSKRSPIYIESMFGKEEMGWAPLSGLIHGEYKFISLPEPELYHLKADPGEKQNLFRSKSHIAKKMDKKLASLVLKYSSASKGTKRELSPEDIRHLRSLGYISAFSSKSENAIDPKKGIVFKNWLKSLDERIRGGDLDGPEEELKKAIRDTPHMANYLVYKSLYQIRLLRNDINGAKKVLFSGIKKFPDSVVFRMLLANMLHGLKQYDEALFHCREILKRDPRYNRATILMAQTYYNLGKRSEALDCYQKAVDIEPNNVALKICYSGLLIEEKQFKKTLEIYDGLLDNPDVSNHAAILYKIALFKTQHGNLNSAEFLLRRVVKLESKGRYHYYFALVLGRNRKEFEAVEQMKIALEQFGNDLSIEQKKTGQRAMAIWLKPQEK